MDGPSAGEGASAVLGHGAFLRYDVLDPSRSFAYPGLQIGGSTSVLPDINGRFHFTEPSTTAPPIGA